MHRQLELQKAINKEYIRIKDLALRLEKRFDELPHGSLSIKQGYHYRVVSDRGKTIQLPIPSAWPGSEALIKDLKERRHIKKALPVLKNNLNCYARFIEGLQIYNHTDISKLLPAIYQDSHFSILIPQGDLDPEVWRDAVYATNTAYPQDLIHESEGGLLTRSKAEAMIATKLEQRNLIFRYEPELHLGQNKVYPDFGVLRSADRKLIYWEHFGKMDDPVYAYKTMEKLADYSNFGYRLGDNLIMTWETKNIPLTFRSINECIAWIQKK